MKDLLTRVFVKRMLEAGEGIYVVSYCVIVSERER